jgi:hypothetical protein
LNRKVVALTATLLIVIIVLTLFFTHNIVNNQTSGREFYVGVEYAYSDNLGDLKALVAKVKDYTNLFVMGDVGITFNQTILTQACDYIYNAKLNFIVLFTGLDMYTNYSITAWMSDAKARYGDSFLGIDRFDEPGGNQLDDGKYQLIHSTMINSSTTYADVDKNYTLNLGFFPNYYSQFAPKVFTSDYGLYWFDYKANYSAIFGEFVGNESRQRHIALCRGAADAFGKDWGVVVTWKYDQAPYLEGGGELYSDLSLAYSAGAKYVVVFNYGNPNTTPYGTLTQDHFDNLKKFWDTLHSNPGSFGSNPPTAAYIVPASYGFGFRSPKDTIWGLFPADNYSAKIYNDINVLTTKYGAQFSILYDEQERILPLLSNYTAVFYYNQTIT